MLRFMGRKESDMTEQLNWTEYNPVFVYYYSLSGRCEVAALFFNALKESVSVTD